MCAESLRSRIQQHVRGKQDLRVVRAEISCENFHHFFVAWYLIDSPFPIFTCDRTAAAAENEFLRSNNSFFYSLIDLEA